MSRTRILLLAEDGRPSPWLIVDAAGHVLQRGQLAPGERLEGEPVGVVLIVPGSDVLVRWLDLPRKAEAQVAAAALWTLKDALAVEPDRMTVALGPQPVEGEARLVAAAARPLVEAWTAWVENAGGKVDVILPDSLATPEPARDDDGRLTAVRFGERTALRGIGFAFSGEAELAELVAEGRVIEPIADPEAVERALIAAALRPPVNLAGRRRPPPASPGRWRRAAVLATAAALSPLILIVAQAGRDEIQARRLDAQARASARAALPDLSSTADPAAEIARRLSEAPPPGGTAAAAARLFAALERVDGAELDSLTLDGGVLRATVTYANASDIDALLQAGASQGLALTAQSTVEDNGRMVSDMVVGGAS